MHFDERRTHFLQDRLLRRLKECRVDSFYSYYRLLISPQGKDELAKLLENLTVNETSFFRHKAQLDLFPENRAGRPAQAQSRRGATTPSASGARAAPPGRKPTPWPCWSPTRWPTTTCATPCPSRCRCPNRWCRRRGGWKFWPATSATPCCAPGRKAPTARPDVDRSTTAYRLRYFDKVGERYAIKKPLKEMVHFDFHNLKTEYLPQRNDVIFCRNVMMYFDEAEQKRLIEKFYRCLNAHGYPVRGPCREPCSASPRSFRWCTRTVAPRTSGLR
jgi:chemotaxis protein methyltransferase CheR